MNIIQEWNSKTGREQQEFIKACVLKAAKQEFGMSALYQHGHSIDEYISEVWIELTENRLTPANVERDNAEREREGKAPITLASMIYKATRAVMSASIRHDRKADSRDGGELDPEQHKGTDTTADITATLLTGGGATPAIVGGHQTFQRFFFRQLKPPVSVMDSCPTWYFDGEFRK